MIFDDQTLGTIADHVDSIITAGYTIGRDSLTSKVTELVSNASLDDDIQPLLSAYGEEILNDDRSPEIDCTVFNTDTNELWASFTWIYVGNWLMRTYLNNIDELMLRWIVANDIVTSNCILKTGIDDKIVYISDGFNTL